MQQFGRPSLNHPPQDRPGAYGVALSEGRLLVVEWRGHLYLPRRGAARRGAP